VEADLDDAQRDQRTRAVAARDAMFQELFKTLSAEIQRDGPAEAISVCREKAPEIAEGIAKAYRVRIGRTSFRLRNAANVPPAWVGALTADRPDTPRYSRGPAGELGALLPIKVQATCLVCHGPPEALPPEVRNRLREEYPEDTATGFAEGDLRGWFWIEVPRAP